MNSQLKGHLYVILATIVIAGSFIATANVSDQLHPISLNLMRFTIATLTLLPIALMRKNAWQSFWKVLPRSLVISFFFCGYFVSNFAAMLTTTTINVGSIYTLTPLVTALLSVFLLKHRLTLRILVIYLLGMIGTLWVIFEGNLQYLREFNLNQGDLVFLVGVVFMACYTIAMKRLYRDDDVTIMTFANLFGGVVWTLIAVVVVDIDLNWYSLKSEYYPSMAYLAIAATFLTSYLYQKASTYMSPVNISAYIYLSPAFVALLSIAMTGEAIKSTLWIGILLSAFATAVLQWITLKKR
ncbi:DMT family transporter [Photobacterium minamisatsumaniensis]|uniref:DMT family transporter n=1 Tax=Photobacterium minamisatsumaniensis TaxID=2910233 RepID=UPI003D103C66